MLSRSTVVIFFTDELAANDIYESIPPAMASDVALSSRRALDGDAVTWMMIATIATTALKTMLNATIKLVELRRVRSIKVGSIEVRNPDRADVERLLAHIEATDSADTSIQSADNSDADGS
jgi:hypothetical protein